MNYFNILTTRILFLFFFLYFIFISFSSAEELNDCADKLASLQNSAKEASKAAQDAEDAKVKFNDKRGELEDKKVELDNCVNDSISHSGCETLKLEYEHAVDEYISSRDEYQSALDILKSNLSDLQDKIQGMESSCVIGFSNDFQSQHDEQTQQDNSPECNFVLKYKGELPDKVILEICSKHFSFEKCVTCLGLK